jgi:integrase/recombinase XerD
VLVVAQPRRLKNYDRDDAGDAAAERLKEELAAIGIGSHRVLFPRDCDATHVAMRRLELANLKLYDLDTERGTLMIRQGKGKKDRVIPIGDRAAAWVEKYVQNGRTHLVVEPDDGTVFLSNAGEPFSLDHLSDLVRVHVDAAQIGKRGACHLFRHTIATLMLENGADIRYIQAMLGHADLKTTQIYTQVSIRHLKQIHSATHPAQLPKKDGDAKPDEAAREELLNALAAEQDEDEEQEP